MNTVLIIVLAVAYGAICWSLGAANELRMILLYGRHEEKEK